MDLALLLSTSATAFLAALGDTPPSPTAARRPSAPLDATAMLPRAEGDIGGVLFA